MRQQQEIANALQVLPSLSTLSQSIRSSSLIPSLLHAHVSRPFQPLEAGPAHILNVGSLSLYQSRGAFGHEVANVRYLVTKRLPSGGQGQMRQQIHLRWTFQRSPTPSRFVSHSLLLPRSISSSSLIPSLLHSRVNFESFWTWAICPPPGSFPLQR